MLLCRPRDSQGRLLLRYPYRLSQARSGKINYAQTPSFLVPPHHPLLSSISRFFNYSPSSGSSVFCKQKTMSFLLSKKSEFDFDFIIVFFRVLKKCHPDRARNQAVAGEAKRRFQQIQEAYSGNIITITTSLVN